MPKIEPADRARILSTDIQLDQDGYAGTANLCTGGKLVHLSMNTPEGVTGLPCTLETAIAFSAKFGPVENLYANSTGSAVVTDVFAHVRAIAASLRPGAVHPGRYWILMDPRKSGIARSEARTAVLYSIEKPDGLYRYVLYACLVPCAEDGLFHANAASCRLDMPKGAAAASRAGEPMSGGVRVRSQDLAYKFVRGMWQAELSRRAAPTQELPARMKAPAEASAGWADMYAFTGSKEWASARDHEGFHRRTPYPPLEGPGADVEKALWALDDDPLYI